MFKSEVTKFKSKAYQTIALIVYDGSQEKRIQFNSVHMTNSHSTFYDKNNQHYKLNFYNLSQFINHHSSANQSLGFLRTFINLPSALPGEGSCMYSQRAVNGSDIRMLSILAPGVYRPNFVPRS